MSIVGVRQIDTGEVTWHADADPGGNYDTLCGLSLTDDEMEGVQAARGQKIDCANCFGIWTEARKFRRSNFK